PPMHTRRIPPFLRLPDTGSDGIHRTVPVLVCRQAPFILRADQLSDAVRGAGQAFGQCPGSAASLLCLAEFTQRNMKARHGGPGRDCSSDLPHAFVLDSLLAE